MTTNTQNPIATDIAAFVAGDKQIKRALPHMTVTLVTAHRDSADGNPVIVQDDNGNGIVRYADLMQWALNVENMSQDDHKKFVTKVKADMLAADSKGRSLVSAIASNAAWIKDNKKSSDPDKLAEVNRRDAQMKDDVATRNAAYRNIERAVFAAVWAIENPIRHAYKTLAMGNRGSVATVENGNGRVITAPVSTWAKDLRKDHVEWNMTDDERAAQKAQATAKLNETRAAQTQTVSEPVKLATQAANMTGGEHAILERAASIVAKYDDETPPRGETRDDLLALYHALTSVFTPEQVAAYAKRNG